MLSFIIDILLSAVIFTYFIPQLPGARFSGEFWPHGILFGLLMAVATSILMAVAMAAILLLILLIAGIVGANPAAIAGLAVIAILLTYFLSLIMTTVGLKILANVFPQRLGFSGWWPAIIAGLLFVVLHVLGGYVDSALTTAL